jgi:tRNA G46 methylase TrmB
VLEHIDVELSGQAADADGKKQVSTSHAEKESDHEKPVEQLCFDEIFPSAIAAASTTVVPDSTRVLPINLELGSGAGEWIANRANASSGSANWIAVEWRNDRVFEIWSKARFSGLDNVLVLSGDMSHIIQQRIQEGTIADVFINFPEPLQGDDNSKQVLSLELFTRLHALLRPRSSSPHDGGKSSVTVVTDDSALCKAIAGHFAQLQHMFTHHHSDKGYDTNVPNDYGSSFFDRFWDHGHKKKRFYLRYFRIDTSPE